MRESEKERRRKKDLYYKQFFYFNDSFRDTVHAILLENSFRVTEFNGLAQQASVTKCAARESSKRFEYTPCMRRNFLHDLVILEILYLLCIYSIYVLYITETLNIRK